MAPESSLGFNITVHFALSGPQERDGYKNGYSREEHQAAIMAVLPSRSDVP